MRRYVILTALVTMALAAPALAAGPVDLSGWTGESAPAPAGVYTQPGEWQVQSGNEVVTQVVNGAPTFFASGHPADDYLITVDFTMPDGFDDDFFGLALGYDPGDITNPGADYLLVDWRKAAQSISWFDLPDPVQGTPGLALTRINGVPLWGELWSHASVGGGAAVEELARGSNLGDAGWVNGSTYHFVIEYETDRLRLWVNDQLEFDQTGTFPTGGFALYAFSQAGVQFGPVTFEQINDPPQVESGASDVIVPEGSMASTSGSFSDPDGDPLDLSCSGFCAGFVDNGDGSWRWSRLEPDDADDRPTVVTADDGLLTVNDGFTVTVTNLAPVITSTSGVPTLSSLATGVTASADFTDAGFEDTHVATFNWGDGSSSPGAVSESGDAGNATASHQYQVPGTYTVAVTVTDDDGGSDTAQIGTVFVFDPDTFVTGGGWVSSPVGSLPGQPEASPKATFGFVARWTRSGTVAGNLELQAGRGFNLHATSLRDLRIVDGIARFSGTARLNGEAGFSFDVVATDERLATSDRDLFWITVGPRVGRWSTAGRPIHQMDSPSGVGASRSTVPKPSVGTR